MEKTSYLTGWEMAALLFQETAQKDATGIVPDVCTGRISGAPCCHNLPESAVESFIGEALKKIIEIKNEAGFDGEKLFRCGNKSLGVCSIVCKCHLATKVFTPMKHIRKFTSDEEFKKLPGYCWQRTEVGV